MTLSSTDHKKSKIKTPLTDCLFKYKISLKELPRILGKGFPVVIYVSLHYSHLEREKITGLKYHRRNFEGKIILRAKAKAKIQNDVCKYHYINITSLDITV